MRRISRHLLATVGCVFGLGHLSVSAQTFTEFSVGPLGFAEGVTAGPDGALWISGLAGVGRLTTDGQFSMMFTFQPPFCAGHPSRPPSNDITQGPDGNLWFTDEFCSKIIRLTPSGGWTPFQLAAGSAPTGITEGPDGNIWFAAQGSGRIGRITPAGSIAQYSLPAGLHSPLRITGGPDGNVWFTATGEATGFIGRITPSGEITSFPLPVPGAVGITTGPDGALWFTSADAIGRIQTNGTVSMFAVPTPESLPDGITAGPDGAIWFTESARRKIGRVSTDGIVEEFSVPFEGGFLARISSGPDEALWFVERGPSPQAGRFEIDSLCAPDSETLCLNERRFKVSVAWSASNVDRSGSGQAKALTEDTGAFWFFHPSNLELVVKVLDGRPVNGHFWVFYGALSNVEYTITVTDTLTNEVRSYSNPEGTLASGADTQAF